MADIFVSQILSTARPAAAERARTALLRLALRVEVPLPPRLPMEGLRFCVDDG